MSGDHIGNFFYSEVDGITKLMGKSTAGDYAYNALTLVDVDVVDFLDSSWNVPQATSEKNIILTEYYYLVMHYMLSTHLLDRDLI